MRDQVITEKNMYVTLSFQHFLHGIKRKLYINIFSAIILINGKFIVTNLGRFFISCCVVHWVRKYVGEQDPTG
jgi:hypothetical protein